MPKLHERPGIALHRTQEASVFSLINPAVLLLLVGRAVFSTDPMWRRATAVFVVGIVLMSPHIFPLLGGKAEHYSFISVGSSALAAAYLFSWTFRSRDRPLLRTASALLELFVLAPMAIAVTMSMLILYG